MMILSNQPSYCGGNGPEVESKDPCPNSALLLTSFASQILGKSFLFFFFEFYLIYFFIQQVLISYPFYTY